MTDSEGHCIAIEILRICYEQAFDSEINAVITILSQH